MDSCVVGELRMKGQTELVPVFGSHDFFIHCGKNFYTGFCDFNIGRPDKGHFHIPVTGKTGSAMKASQLSAVGIPFYHYGKGGKVHIRVIAELFGKKNQTGAGCKYRSIGKNDFPQGLEEFELLQ